MATQGSRLCFVTIGATASFSGLIKAVLAPEFCQALESEGYTELLVQYGQGGDALFESCAKKLQATEDRVKVTGFALDKSGLGRYMRDAKGNDKELKEGVVISHAGISNLNAPVKENY